MILAYSHTKCKTEEQKLQGFLHFLKIIDLKPDFFYNLLVYYFLNKELKNEGFIISLV